MSQVNICFFTESQAPGGLCTHIALLIECLDPRQYTPYLVCPPTATDLIARAQAAGAIYHPLTGPQADDPAAYVMLEMLLRETPMHIFHNHVGSGLEGAAGIRAAHAAGVPVIVATEHSPYVLPPGLTADRKAQVNGLVDRIIITSDEARYSHLAGGAVTARQVVTIPQAINPAPFLQIDPGPTAALRQSLDLAPGTPVVGMVGRMYEQKGHRYLLDAWPAVHVAQPEAVLALVGDGPLRAELEAQAARLGITDSVTFLGTRTDLPALLDLCTLVVLPSLFEGFPLIVLEAMAAGRPVVGTRVCGAGEAIVDGETGRLVPPADPDALATAIVRLLRTPAKARRMGQAGRLRAVRDFHIRRMADQTCRLYTTLLDEKAQPYPLLDAASAAAYVVL